MQLTAVSQFYTEAEKGGYLLKGLPPVYMPFIMLVCGQREAKDKNLNFE